MAGDPGRPQRAHRGADRLGQDAGRLSRGDRRAGAPGRRGRTARRDADRLRLAAEGALERHPQESRGAARRHPRGVARARPAGCRNPHLGAHRRHAAGRARPQMRRRPPHIVVTTPESLYILLGSESGRAMLATTRTVIVDEIHALAPNKRGSHLALSLERLAALCGGRLLRDRPLGDAEADRGGGAVPGRRDGRRGDLHDHRHRPSPRARPRARGAGLAARGGDVGRGLGGGLRPPRRADRGASHDARLRQHPAHGRARDPPAVGAHRRRPGDRASRQPRQGAAPRRRAAPQGAARCRRWSRPPRSSSASTSARSISSARSARRARSRPSCSASAAPATPSTARPRAGSSRCRATSSSNARRCSTACGAASSIALDDPRAPLDVLAQQIVAEVAAAGMGRGCALSR